MPDSNLTLSRCHILTPFPGVALKRTQERILRRSIRGKQKKFSHPHPHILTMKLNYKTFGSGPPVIILHGLFGMLDNWRSIARALQANFQCILVDLRNHGKSPHDAEMNYKVMSEDILELTNDLLIESAIIMGHSMGGKVAMQFALTYPERVDKLIIIDISPKKYPPHHDHVIEAIESIDPENLVKRTDAEEILRKHIRNDEPTIQFLLKNLNRLPEGGFGWKANMPVLVAEYGSLLDGISSDTICHKRGIFIRGELSGSLKDDDWPEIQALFPNTQLVTIPGAGHWVHIDQPRALIEVLLAFIQL